MSIERGRLIRTSEAAKILGINRVTLLDWHNDGRGPAASRAHSGAHLMWSLSQVERLKAARDTLAEMKLLHGNKGKRSKSLSVAATALRRRRKGKVSRAETRSGPRCFRV